jgi:hypothetical protein
LKIKQDFVTNSSSTAFIINWKKYNKDPDTIYSKEEAQAYLESYGREWDSTDHIRAALHGYVDTIVHTKNRVKEEDYQSQIYSHVLHYVKETKHKWVVWVLRDESLSDMDDRMFPHSYSDDSYYKECGHEFPHL